MKDNAIDTLVIGRRGMNTFQRLVTGSVSKYCLENADCNVLVVKVDPYSMAYVAFVASLVYLLLLFQGSYNIEEEHDSLSAVISAEEQERQRRIRMEKREYTPTKPVQQQQQHFYVVYFESRVSLTLLFLDCSCVGGES